MNDFDSDPKNQIKALVSPTVHGTSEMAEYGRKFSFKGVRPPDVNDFNDIVSVAETTT